MNTIKSTEYNNCAGFKPIKQVELTNFLLNNLQNFNLKPTTKLVLLYLSSCYNPRNADVFPKQRTIADKMGISEASVIRAIAELHKEGLIISERKYSNRYKFTQKLLLNCEKIVFLQDNKKQVKNLQNETGKLAKCDLHEHEQVNKQVNKQQEEVANTTRTPLSMQDFEKLKKYATKKGAKNPTAYAHAIINGGSAGEILDKIKAEQTRKIERQKAAQRRTEEIEREKELSCPPPAKWQELRAKLLANCTIERI